MRLVVEADCRGDVRQRFALEDPRSRGIEAAAGEVSSPRARRVVSLILAGSLVATVVLVWV